MGLTPIILNGQPTCPDGYQYDPGSNSCLPVTGALSFTVTGGSLPDVDPKNAAELAGLGNQDSGWGAYLATCLWHGLVRFLWPDAGKAITLPQAVVHFVVGAVRDGVQAYLQIYDAVLAVVADFLSVSVSRNIPAFWTLIGALISDLLGVNLDGAALYSQLQAHGTLAAMQAVGAGLIDLLIGEFTGTATGTGGTVTFSSSVNPSTGLPPATLTPSGGVDAAKALMGFVLSSAVREANVEGITDSLPFGLGSAFKQYSEAMRTNLGIGRMLRFALRPLFQVLVADQMKQAMHIQYLPTLLNMAEAVRGVNSGDVDEPGFSDLAARAGYNVNYARSLRNQHTLNPPVGELITLRAAGRIADQDFDLWMRRHGFSSATAALLAQASDLMPARRVSLALAEHYLLEYGRGTITGQAFKDFVDGLKASGYLLSTGEVSAIEAIASAISITKKVRPRHLAIGQLTTAYIDGVIDLLTFQQHLADVGFDPEDVQIETEVLLIKARAAAAAAAAKQARLAAKTGTTPPPSTPPLA